MENGRVHIFEGLCAVHYAGFTLDGQPETLPLIEYVSRYLEPQKLERLLNDPVFFTNAKIAAPSARLKLVKQILKDMFEYGWITRTPSSHLIDILIGESTSNGYSVR